MLARCICNSQHHLSCFYQTLLLILKMAIHLGYLKITEGRGDMVYSDLLSHKALYRHPRSSKVLLYHSGISKSTEINIFTVVLQCYY